MTLIQFLFGPKDALDELAHQAIRLMFRAKRLETKSARDAATAWLMADMALQMISDNVKHYPFLPCQHKPFLMVNAQGLIVEPSASMSSPPLPPGTVDSVSRSLLSRAESILSPHEEPPLAVDDQDFFKIEPGASPAVASAYSTALETVGHAPTPYDRYVLVAGDGADHASNFAAVSQPAFNRIFARRLDESRVNSLDDLRQALAGILSAEPATP